jgi:hypothetical protein
MNISGNSRTTMIGMALFLSTLTFAIASAEMSSRFSVENFATTQEILNNAMKALSTYMIIALIWACATCLVLYGDYKWEGVMWGLGTNTLMIGWIIGSYYFTFRTCAKKSNLKVPSFFNFGYNPSPVAREIAGGHGRQT